MNRSHRLLPIALAAMTAALGGCRHFQWGVRQPTVPVVFQQQPTLDQLMQTVNANTDRVQRLQADGATLTVPGAPRLRANLALERPRRLRLRADTGLTGSELDLGSNDELFWMWVKRNQPPTVFFARHQQYHASAARSVFSVEPQWLHEALGLVRFDPASRHDGPFAGRDNLVEVRSVRATPTGPQTRVALIDGQHGFVAQQHVYDAQGKLLASAIASDHRFDAASGVLLPHRVQVQLPPTQMAFTLAIDGYLINRLEADPARLWTMPRMEGHRYVDLADPRLPMSSPAAAPLPAASQPQAPRAAAVPWHDPTARYQGYR